MCRPKPYVLDRSIRTVEIVTLTLPLTLTTASEAHSPPQTHYSHGLSTPEATNSDGRFMTYTL